MSNTDYSFSLYTFSLQRSVSVFSFPQHQATSSITFGIIGDLIIKATIIVEGY